jgi:hypothetical protein
MNSACQAEKACEAAGGEYSTYPPECVYEGGADAGDDAAQGPFQPPCCNGNGDPCCLPLYCDAGMTAECANELACIDAGTWDANVYTCVAPPDAADDGPSSTDDAGDGALTPSADAAGDDAADGDAHD